MTLKLPSPHATRIDAGRICGDFGQHPANDGRAEGMDAAPADCAAKTAREINENTTATRDMRPYSMADAGRPGNTPLAWAGVPE